MASIRASGGVGGGRLRKVDDSQKRDRSAVTASASSGASAGHDQTSSAAPTGGEAGLANALAAALSKRKTRVSQSGRSCMHPLSYLLSPANLSGR